MTHFLRGLESELVKSAGLAGSALKTVVKHPLLSLGVVGTAGATGVSAVEGYRKGLQPGERGRMLAASKHGPSEAFYTNYNQLFADQKKPTPAKLRQMHEFYNPRIFKR